MLRPSARRMTSAHAPSATAAPMSSAKVDRGKSGPAGVPASSSPDDGSAPSPLTAAPRAALLLASSSMCGSAMSATLSQSAASRGSAKARAASFRSSGREVRARAAKSAGSVSQYTKCSRWCATSRFRPGRKIWTRRDPAAAAATAAAAETPRSACSLELPRASSARIRSRSTRDRCARMTLCAWSTRPATTTSQSGSMPPTSLSLPRSASLPSDRTSREAARFCAARQSVPPRLSVSRSPAVHARTRRPPQAIETTRASAMSAAHFWAQRRRGTDTRSRRTGESSPQTYMARSSSRSAVTLSPRAASTTCAPARASTMRGRAHANASGGTCPVRA